MKLGDKIRSYRKKAGYTQHELAKIIHVTPQAVSNWERNKRVPDLELFPLLGRAIGISYDELFNGKNLEFYPEEQKELLLKRCLENASVANRLCAMLDRWEQKSLEIKKLEDEELKRRGVDVSAPFRTASEIDPLGLADKIILKKKMKLDAFVKENGRTAMAYVLMILYLGEDIAHGSWDLPKVSDPKYKDSVCNLLLTTKNPGSGNFHQVPDPGLFCLLDLKRKQLPVCVHHVHDQKPTMTPPFSA